jgi:hypothetical protein
MPNILQPIIQQSFAGGQISEPLQSREDLAKQQIALLTLRNAIVSVTGSVKNRSGTKFIAEVEDSAKVHRLMPFIFSREQAYGLVWGDQVLRIIKESAIVGGDHATPYLAAQNALLYDAQSADVMYLTQPSYTPYKLTRTSDTAWTLTAIDFQDGPYLPFQEGDDDITLTPSADTGAGVTITASDAAAFTTVVVGDHIRLGYENPLDISQIDWGWATVTATPTSTTRTVTVEKNFGFEYFLNPDFKDGIAFWENHSPVPGDALLDHEVVTQTMRFVRTTTNVLSYNNVAVAANEDLELEVIIHTLSSANFQISVGTTAGAVDILALQTETSTGTYTYTVRPTQSSIWVNLVNATAGTAKLSRVSLRRLDLATRHWRRSAWNSDRGWPNTVTIHEQRVAYGGNNIDNPDTIWETEVGEYERFGFNTPILDTDALSYVLNSNQVNAIEWIRSHGELMVGTTGDEWRIAAGSQSNTITPTSIDARTKSNTGSASVKPIIAGDILFFLNRNKDRVFALGYSLEADAYKPIDMTILARNLFDGYQITEWAYQQTPDSVIWMIRDDGKMLSLSFNNDQDIWAWSWHDTVGTFESVCVVPETTGDIVYLIVKRTIDGSDVRYVEVMQPRIADEDQYDYYSVDCGLIHNTPKLITNITTANPLVITSAGHNFSDGFRIRIDGVVGMTPLNGNYYLVANKTANTFELTDLAGNPISSVGWANYISGGEARWAKNSLSGLSHLEGETVSILADGSVVAQQAVSSGNVTNFGVFGGVVHVGLPYDVDIKTLPHDYVTANGQTSQGRGKKLVKTNIYFNKTGAAAVGSDEDGTLYDVSFNVETDTDAPPPLFTGVAETKVEDVYDKLTHTFIRRKGEEPLPIEVVGIISEVDFSDK